MKSLLYAALWFVPAFAAFPQSRPETANDVVTRARQATRSPSFGAELASRRREAGPTPRGRLATLWIATAARRRYEYAVSDAAYQRLIADRATEPGVLAKAYAGYGQSLTTRWRVDEATAALNQAVQVAAAVGDAEAEGESLLTLVSIMGRMGKLDSARVLSGRAARVGAPDSRVTIARLCSEGSALRGSSLRTADSLVTLGAKRAAAMSDTVLMARCALSQATVYEARGSQGRAVEQLIEASRLATGQHDDELAAVLYQWRAYHNAAYGSRFAGSRQLADSAIAIAGRVGNPIVAAWARTNLAQAAIRVGDASLAYRSAALAVEQFRRLGDKQGEAAGQGVKAQSLMLSGRLPEAVEAYESLEGLLAATGAPNAVPYLQLQRAAALTDLGIVQRSAALVDSAAAGAARMGLVGISGANVPYARGRLALRRGQYTAAIEEFEKFKRSIGTGGRPQLLDAELRIAEAFAGSGRFAMAESVFANASGILDGLRNRAESRDDVLRLLAGLRFDSDPDLGIATIVNGVARGGAIEPAFGIAESERARWLWTQRIRRQATAEVEQKEEALDDRRLPIDDVRGALDGRTAVLAYTIGRRGEPTTAFVIWRDGARAFSLRAIDSLAPDITRFVSTLESDGSGQALARSLGAALLGDAVRALPPQVDQLRIVPDGALYHVPFDALLLTDGRRVVERYVVNLVPSVRLAVAPSRGAGGSRVLAFGDPLFDPGLDLPRLPGSSDEVAAVMRASGGRGEVLLRERARAAALRGRDWRGVGAVHLATHARVQDFGLFDNAVFLSRGAGDDGRLAAADIAAIPLDVDLVVLSACRTAGGVVLNGEGAQGLVGPVLEAGARSVAVTLWNVRDRSLTTLMRDFYLAMARGTSAVEALALAKRASLRSGAPPSTWAAVTLVGDGTVRPLASASSAPAGAAGPTGGLFHRPGSPSPTSEALRRTPSR